MKTCGLCGTKLDNNYCSYCEMELKERYILKDGQRLRQGSDFMGYPDRSKIFSTTNELMQLETIELLCLLREARSYRAEAYKLRVLRHNAEKQEEFNEEVSRIDEFSYDEYSNATRKVWVIENIIKDRLGYFPQKVTMNFLNMYLERMEKSEQKIMKMEGQRSHATK